MPPASAARARLCGEPEWPAQGGRRPIFLLDASSGLEARLLRAWIERNRPADVPADWDAIRIPPSRRRRRRRRTSLSRLEACLASEGDALLVPLRVAWIPRERDGARDVRFRDLFLLGDPRDPHRLRQAWILRREPDRCRIVAGEPATAAELRARWRRASGVDLDETTGLPEFVVRQAMLALERAERRLRGARYKVPRFVTEDLTSRAAFRGGVRRLARELGRDEARVARDAARILREIAATHSPFVIDLVAHGTKLLYTRGYEEALHYEREELEGVEALAQRHPVVFLPSHKSQLDHLVLQYALHENGHPPNHTAGGINMNFFPVGPLVRRAGVFFIRRSFKDDEVYKFVLQQYIDYLIEKRFSLEWYIEGGRSRSGKLLPPRFGMLAYVVDAYRRGRADDVFLIPVSIAYDQIQDVAEYAAEQRGLPKEPESFGWFVRVIRRLSRRYGAVHLRFGRPLSLAEALGRPDPEAEPNPDDRSLELRKLAFEVCVRINRVTPITPASLVTLALLGTGDQARTVGETQAAMRNLLHYVRTRSLPTTLDLEELETPEGVRATLESLASNDVVERFEEGAEPVYRIGPEQQLAAAYYRNTVIHFFVNSAICELALLRAADEDVHDPIRGFWNAAMQLRDLLKFEFFFSEKQVFQDELTRELQLQDGDWEKRLEEGPEGIRALVRNFRPFSSHRVLRPFLEAYRVVGDHLERWDPAEPVDSERFLRECLGLARQYHLQHRIRSAASCSKVLLETGLRVADNRGLLENVSRDIGVWRSVFADEIRSSIRRVEAIDALAASRRTGLIE